MRGGERKGAGRPKGRGPFGEATQAMRIPLSKIQKIKQIIHGNKPINQFIYPSSLKKFPLLESPVQAGFPSSAEGHIEKYIDLNEHLISKPASTYFIKAKGQSMIGAGIFDGDMLIVDRSLTPKQGKIVIAIVNGEFTVKRIIQKDNKIFLIAENPSFPDIAITGETELMIWGVVVHVLHAV